MVGGIDQQDGDAVNLDAFHRRESDWDREPFARALAAAATVASSCDLQRAGAALAREMCQLAASDECCVQLHRTSDVLLLSRYLAHRGSAGRAGARCDVVAQTASLPLVHEDEQLGSVDLCWQTPGPKAGAITPEMTALRDLAAAHLFAAVECDEQRRRLRALDDLATDMRRQLHEHANRMQVLSGLHELGDNVAAHRFLTEMVGGYEASPAVRVGKIHDPIVAGTLVALMRNAQRRQVRFELDTSSRLPRLAPKLNVLDLVTVVANCITNALDAASAQSGERRLIRVKLAAEQGGFVLSVRDRGPGVQGRTLDELCRPGSTTKQGHHGVGLTLVREIVETREGSLDLEDSPNGVNLVVALPCT
jgi:anti-sigma regulatory factor (Ser/Thr protein kinase)